MNYGYIPSESENETLWLWFQKPHATRINRIINYDKEDRNDRLYVQYTMANGRGDYAYVHGRWTALKSMAPEIAQKLLMRHPRDASHTW